MLIATLGDGIELRLMELRYLPAYHQLRVRNYKRLYWLPGEPTLQDSERRLRDGLARFVEGAGIDRRHARTANQRLGEGDRLDLCRPLQVDPMTARRLRAAATSRRKPAR